MTEAENDLEVETGLKSSKKDVYPNAVVKVSREQYSTFQIKRMVEETKQIKLDPEFQRNQVWRTAQKIELIESILMGIPIPTIYFFENKLGIKQMVDGRQRISAIIDFMNDKFKLNDLKMLSMFNKKSFTELEAIYKNKISDYQLSIYVIEYPTPEQVKYDIFDRVNRSGTPLNNQEMRNALYYGNSTKLIKQIAESPEFLEATGSSIKPARMKDRYAILRLIGFYLLRTNKLDFYYKSNIDEFLVLVMEYLNQQSDEIIELLKMDVILAMNCSYTLLGEDAFRFNISNVNKRPLNMALFESLGYFFMIKNISNARPDELKQQINNLKDLFDLEDKFRYAVDSSSNVDYRFSKIEEFAKDI